MRIAAAIPAGVRVIDGTGKFVMPGIIDAHSHAALENGINEGSESVTPEVQVQLKNDDPVIYRALAGGVTAANLLHGSANTIGGQSRVIKMRWGMPADSMYFKGAYRIVKFALGENVTQASGQAPLEEKRFPATRMGVDFTLRYWFTKAKEYDKQWQDYRAAAKTNPNAMATLSRNDGVLVLGVIVLAFLYDRWRRWREIRGPVGCAAVMTLLHRADRCRAGRWCRP